MLHDPWFWCGFMLGALAVIVALIGITHYVLSED